jgi:hypothetical protein
MNEKLWLKFKQYLEQNSKIELNFYFSPSADENLLSILRSKVSFKRISELDMMYLKSSGELAISLSVMLSHFYVSRGMTGWVDHSSNEYGFRNIKNILLTQYWTLKPVGLIPHFSKMHQADYHALTTNFIDKMDVVFEVKDFTDDEAQWLLTKSPEDRMDFMKTEDFIQRINWLVKSVRFQIEDIEIKNITKEGRMVVKTIQKAENDPGHRGQHRGCRACDGIWENANKVSEAVFTRHFGDGQFQFKSDDSNNNNADESSKEELPDMEEIKKE